MGKNAEICTTVMLTGPKVEDYLASKGIQEITPVDETGNFVIGRSAGRDIVSLLGNLTIQYGIVERETHTNLEVVISNACLRRTGKKDTRRISVGTDLNDSNQLLGKQQLTNGVDLVVQTNVPIAVFESNKR